jgi:PKD repeat protein
MLIAPSVDLSGGYTSAELSFETYHYDQESYIEHDYVKISTNGGSTWTTFTDLANDEADNFWDHPIVIDLSAYLGQSDVTIAFHRVTPDGGEAAWLIDDVEISVGTGGSSGTDIYGGADGIMIQGFVDDVLIDGNLIQDIHSKGWCYGVEITPTYVPPLSSLDIQEFFYEDFESGLPVDWTIDNGLEPPTWDDTNPGGRTPPAGSNCDGTFMICDEDYNWVYDWDDYLISPVIDCSDYFGIILDFGSYFHSYSSYDQAAAVDVYDGSTWHNVYSFTGGDDFAQSIDISAIADDNPNVQIRFHFTCSEWSYYWMVDNVKLTGDFVFHPTVPYPTNVVVKCNDFETIGDDSVFEQKYPGICLTVDETSPGANDGNASQVQVHCNNFELGLYAIINKDTHHVLDAQYNWYGDMTGPSGDTPDKILDGFAIVETGIIADGFGAMIVDLGPINFAPWLGINGMIIEPVGPSVTVEVGEPVLFDATGSEAYIYEECCDPFLTHMQYEWDFDDGYYSHIPRTTHVFDSPGTYHVRLMVDSPGFSSTFFDFEYIEVNVVQPGTPLNANADGENLGEYEGMIGEDIQFYGIASGGSGTYHYRWDFGDGFSSKEIDPVHSYRSPGEYTTTLTITDNQGNVASDTVTVTVYGYEELFVGIKSSAQYSQGETISFTSTVGGGRGPYSYSWDFGDGIVSSTQNPQHIYENSGTYIVSLTVTDAQSNSKTTTKTVTIRPTGGISEVEITDVNGGFLLSATIVSEESVSWSIDVDGFVLLGGHADGTALGSTQIKLPFTLGFGSVDVTISAGGTSETYTGFMVGPFLLNLN